MDNIIKAIANALQDPVVPLLNVEEMIHQAVMTGLNKQPMKSLDPAVK